MRLRLFSAGLFLLLLSTGPACAQTPDTTHRAAEAALQRGDYQEARRQFQEQWTAGEAAAVVGLAETYRATGAYDEGLQALAEREAPDDPYWQYAHGRLLEAVGRLEDAEAAYVAALRRRQELWPNVIALADLLAYTGRRGQAQNLYAAVYQRYQQGAFRTAETLSLGARAAAAMGAFHDANTAFRTAYQLEPEHVETLYGWAELFREKFNDAEAQRTYQEALGLNPHHPGLYVGLAQSVNGFAQKEELATQALAVNPNHVAALSIQAELRILDGLYDEAEALLRQALDVNPAAMTALGHLAAIHHLRGDTTAFARVEEQALNINPSAAAFYVTLVDDCVRRFRYPDALAFARQAVAADRRDASAYAAYGTALLRLGQAREAQRYLEASFDLDPFNLYVGNALTLIEEYEDFAVLESEHFTLLIHNAERASLGPAMLETAEAAYDEMHTRYGYTPAERIRLEAYQDAGDFGVRIAGVPHLGLLGVSFGDVVALNTPRAQVGEDYNWARTLWHELAHTMAIGVSDFRVPRWFTEGLSVYEEQRARPYWGREMDLTLFAALDRDRLLPLATLDRGFTRPTFPGQILLSYYHASKVIAFIEAQHGFDAIVGILAALREGRSIEQAIHDVLGQDVAALDRAFRAELQQQRAALDAVLDDMPDPENAAAADRAPASGSFWALLQEGQAHLQAERYDAAEATFREALAQYADYAGGGNPYQGLAAVYRARGEEDQLADVLEAFLDLSAYGAAEARELATLRREAGDAEGAAHYLARSLEVEPYDLEARTALAELYEQQGRYDEAVHHRQAVLELDPVDRSDAYYRLAHSLQGARQPDAAKRAVLQALELAPGFREAQRLLLQIVEP